MAWFINIIYIFICGCVAEKILYEVLWSNFVFRFPGLFTYTRKPKILRLLISGCWTVMASYGVLYRKVYMSMYLIYTACIRVYEQYLGQISTGWSIHHIIFARYLLGLSAIVFCANVSYYVNSIATSSLAIISWKSVDFPSSPPWSARAVLCVDLILNLLRTRRTISIGEDFEAVRKIHIYLVTLTIIRSELNSSILVTVGVLSCFILKPDPLTNPKSTWKCRPASPWIYLRQSFFLQINLFISAFMLPCFLVIRCSFMCCLTHLVWETCCMFIERFLFQGLVYINHVFIYSMHTFLSPMSHLSIT